jgi:hypothetical protein
MRTRWIIAAVMVLIGAGWMAQGMGLLPGTGFMDGDRTWTVIGAVLVVGGLAVGWSAFRLRRGA